MNRLGYKPALDGLRAVSVMGVICFHATGGTGGALGVQIFFVLSGFLITTLLLEEHGENGRISLGAFYRRRIARLLPALVAALAGYVAITWVKTGDLGSPLRASLPPLLSSANAAVVWSHAVPPALSHTWSLSLEDQFYALWPGLLVLFLALRRPGFAGLIAAALALLVTAHATSLAIGGATGARLGLAPDTSGAPILVGCLAAVIAPHARRLIAHRHAWVVDRVGVAVVGLCLLVGYRIVGYRLSETYVPAADLVFSVVVAALILRIASGAQTRLGWLEAKPLVRIGVISYGIYLWHVILFNTVPSPDPFGFEYAHFFLVPLVVVIAAGSHRFVERPFRERAKRRAVLDPAAVAVTP